MMTNYKRGKKRKNGKIQINGETFTTKVLNYKFKCLNCALG